jgi:hypothetical protein
MLGTVESRYAYGRRMLSLRCELPKVHLYRSRAVQRHTGSLASEPAFSASALAPDVMHTLSITVTGAGAHVAVDAFDVTR